MELSRKKTVTHFVLPILLLFLTTGLPCIIFQYIKYYVKADILSSMHSINITTEQGVDLWINEERASIKSWAINNRTLTTYVETLLQSPQTKADLVNHSITEQIRHHLNPIIKSKGYKGFFVISLTSRISFLNSSGVILPPARVPRPPASETAAHSSW